MTLNSEAARPGGGRMIAGLCMIHEDWKRLGCPRVGTETGVNRRPRVGSELVEAIESQGRSLSFAHSQDGCAHPATVCAKTSSTESRWGHRRTGAAPGKLRTGRKILPLTTT